MIGLISDVYTMFEGDTAVGKRKIRTGKGGWGVWGQGRWQFHVRWSERPYVEDSVRGENCRPIPGRGSGPSPSVLVSEERQGGHVAVARVRGRAG